MINGWNMDYFYLYYFFLNLIMVCFWIVIIKNLRSFIFGVMLYYNYSYLVRYCYLSLLLKMYLCYVWKILNL